MEDNNREEERLRRKVEAWKEVHKLAADAIEVREAERRDLWLKKAATDLDEQARLKRLRRLRKLLGLGR